MPSPNSGKTVVDILRTKKASIKNAPFPGGFVGWEAVEGVTWEDIERRAKRSESGFRELKKLLSDQRFNK